MYNRAGEGDDAVLEGLAEGFEGIVAELRQLVEEEDTVLGQAHLAGSGDTAAADEAGVGDGVARRTEGTAREKGLAGGEAGEAPGTHRSRQGIGHSESTTKGAKAARAGRAPSGERRGPAPSGDGVAVGRLRPSRAPFRTSPRPRISLRRRPSPHEDYP
jgi:hypothetical protein